MRILNEVGSLHSSDGKLIIFTKDTINEICKSLNITYAELADRFKGIEVDLHGKDVTVGVDEAVAIHKDGTTYMTPIIGIEIDKFQRFLENNEMTLLEYYRKHRLYKEELNSNDPNYNRIISEYQNMIMKKDPRWNPELDIALNII
jgi:hypothetical protein